MKFWITFTPGANEDMKHLTSFEQRLVIAAIKSYLQTDANVESRRRKNLRPNELALWELRAGKYRVFYDLENETVKIVAIGYKEHNDLFIRGRRVKL